MPCMPSYVFTKIRKFWNLTKPSMPTMHAYNICKVFAPSTAQLFKLFIFNWKSKSRFSPDNIGPGEQKDFTALFFNYLSLIESQSPYFHR